MSYHVAEHLLTQSELRKFGWMMGAVIALIFGLLLPWIWSFDYPFWPWILAAVFAVAATAAPLLLAPVLKAWMAIAEPVGRFNTKLILVLMYVLIIVPLGLALRIFRSDPMRRAYNNEMSSYRIPSIKQESRKLEKPF